MCQLFSHVPVLLQGMLKGQRQTHADQLLVNALTANLLPPSLMDSPEFREFLDFISNGTYIPPHRIKATELIDLQHEKVLLKVLHTMQALFIVNFMTIVLDQENAL